MFVVLSANASTYVVQKGDTLSTIACKLISYKVYGEKGSLQKLADLNPKIKNRDFILPGKEIFVGQSVFTPAAKCEDTKRSIASVDTPILEAEKVPEKSPPFKRGATLALTPYLSILTLKAKDWTTGNLSTVASKYNAGVELAYAQEWSKKFQSQVKVKMGMVDFEKPTNSIGSLIDTQKFLQGFGIETSHELNERLNLTFGLEYGKELFVRSVSTQSETVDVVNVPALGAGLSYNFANLDPFHVGIMGTYKTLFPGSADEYDIKLGQLYGLSFYFKQRMKTSGERFLTELGVYQRKQNTNFSSQTETNLMASFRYFFSIGAREGEK